MNVMKSIAEPEIRIPITFVGLSNAGKTTTINRLTHSKFVESTTPTMGVTGQITKISSLNLQIFDLGGQYFLRSMWKPFVRTSLGTCFVFDASEPELLNESLEWFWKVVDWCEHQGVVLFLANKMDLPHIDIDKILKKLDLPRFAKNPEMSFQLFPVSMKTGLNVDNAFKWFWSKIQQRAAREQVSIHKIHLQTTTGLPIASVNYNEGESGLEVSSTGLPILEASFYSAIEIMAKEALGKKNALKTIIGKRSQIVFIAKENILVAIRMGLNDSTSKARIIGTSLVDFCLTTSLNRGGISEGKNNKVRDFIAQNFPDSIPKNGIK